MQTADSQLTDNTNGGGEWLVSGVAAISVAIIALAIYIAIGDVRDPMSGLSKPKQDFAAHSAQGGSHQPSEMNQSSDKHGSKDSQLAPKQNHQDPMEFVRQLQERLNANPQDKEAMFMLANSHMMIRDFEKAEALYKQVLDITPDHLEARSNLALIALQNKRYDDSVNLLQANLKDHPEHGESVYNLGFIYASYMNDSAKTIKLWEQWLSDYPDHPVNQQLQPLYQQLVQNNKQ